MEEAWATSKAGAAVASCGAAAAATLVGSGRDGGASFLPPPAILPVRLKPAALGASSSILVAPGETDALSGRSSSAASICASSLRRDASAAMAAVSSVRSSTPSSSGSRRLLSSIRTSTFSAKLTSVGSSSGLTTAPRTLPQRSLARSDSSCRLFRHFTLPFRRPLVHVCSDPSDCGSKATSTGRSCLSMALTSRAVVAAWTGCPFTLITRCVSVTPASSAGPGRTLITRPPSTTRIRSAPSSSWKVAWNDEPPPPPLPRPAACPLPLDGARRVRSGTSSGISSPIAPLRTRGPPQVNGMGRVCYTETRVLGICVDAGQRRSSRYSSSLSPRIR